MNGFTNVNYGYGDGGPSTGNRTVTTPLGKDNDTMQVFLRAPLDAGGTEQSPGPARTN